MIKKIFLTSFLLLVVFSLRAEASTSNCTWNYTFQRFDCTTSPDANDYLKDSEKWLQDKINRDQKNFQNQLDQLQQQQREQQQKLQNEVDKWDSTDWNSKITKPYIPALPPPALPPSSNQSQKLNDAMQKGISDIYSRLNQLNLKPDPTPLKLNSVPLEKDKTDLSEQLKQLNKYQPKPEQPPKERSLSEQLPDSTHEFKPSIFKRILNSLRKLF